MEATDGSRTALLVAGYRARATRAGSALCHDPWAAALAGDEGAALCERFDVLQPEMQLWVALRTALIDDHVERRITAADPACQVVILGAGLDARAARLGRQGVSFFEVDHPATQAAKAARLEALEGFPVACAVRVPCDFERDDFVERLLSCGFDPSRPVVVVWEGVVPYLSEEAVRRILRRIAEGLHPRSSVVFDTVGKVMAAGSAKNEADRETGAELVQLGEPIRFGLDHPIPLLYEEGFRKARVTTFDEAALNLTGTYDRARRWRFQSLVEASVASTEGG